MRGENLFNATQVVLKAGVEIQAMFQKTYSMLENNIPRTGLIKKLEDLDIDHDENDEDWACRGCIKNFGLYKNRIKSVPDASIALQVKLFDIEESRIVGPTPLLYVLFAAGITWEYDDFKLSKVFNEDCRYHLENTCLWQYYEVDEEHGIDRDFDEADFAYVIPLVEINSGEDIAELIIEPIKMTILGKHIGKYIESKKKVLKFQVYNDTISCHNSDK